MAKKKIQIEKYEGLGLSDYEILQRSIRDANSKLDRIARTYGTDNTIYKSNLAKLLQVFPRGQFSNRFSTTSKGVTHLSQKIKMDIPESEYLEKAKILTEKIETIYDIKRNVSKAVKEIYGIDIEDVNRYSITQQNKLITNIYRLKDSWTKIIKEFYEVSKYYSDGGSGLKPDVLVPLLRDLPFAKDHPEIIKMVSSNMSSFEAKDGKGWGIVGQNKKTYNDMNNLILLTEAMVKLIEKLEDDADVYSRWVQSQGVKLTL